MRHWHDRVFRQFTEPAPQVIDLAQHRARALKHISLGADARPARAASVGKARLLADRVPRPRRRGASGPARRRGAGKLRGRGALRRLRRRTTSRYALQRPARERRVAALGRAALAGRPPGPPLRGRSRTDPTRTPGAAASQSSRSSARNSPLKVWPADRDHRSGGVEALARHRLEDAARVGCWRERA